MTLDTVIAYAAVLGLPLWLVVEEVLQRFAPGAKAPVVAPGIGGRTARPRRRADGLGGPRRDRTCLFAILRFRCTPRSFAIVRRPLYSVRTLIRREPPDGRNDHAHR